MEKQIYSVMYFGNATIYQDLCEEVAAYSKRHAVEKVYSKMLNENYFPVDEFSWGGLVKDCDGNVIADANDESIEYDGGHFYAELKIVE
jgi:cytidine deaminase